MYKIEAIGKIIDRDLSKIHEDIANRIAHKIYKDLAIDPRGSECKPSKGTKYKNIWRYRVADYRILYKILEDQKTIVLARILHRSKLY